MLSLLILSDCRTEKWSEIQPHTGNYGETNTLPNTSSCSRILHPLHMTKVWIYTCFSPKCLRKAWLHLCTLLESRGHKMRKGVRKTKRNGRKNELPGGERIELVRGKGKALRESSINTLSLPCLPGDLRTTIVLCRYCATTPH